MSHYFHTELAHAVGPDFPKWLDRRWRYPPTPAISKIERDKLMRHALRVYGPRCHWCGRETLRPHQDHGRGQPHHRTLEHLKARGMGGKDTFENTRIACYECNNKRGVVQEWLIWLYRLGLLAPNRLFGAYIRGDEAV